MDEVSDVARPEGVGEAAKEAAEGVVSLWVNNRDDIGAVFVNDGLLLGSHIPSKCADLVRRIAEAIDAATRDEAETGQKYHDWWLEQVRRAEKAEAALAERDAELNAVAGLAWEFAKTDDERRRLEAALAAAPGGQEEARGDDGEVICTIVYDHEKREVRHEWPGGQEGGG